MCILRKAGSALVRGVPHPATATPRYRWIYVWEAAPAPFPLSAVVANGTKSQGCPMASMFHREKLTMSESFSLRLYRPRVRNLLQRC